MLRLCQFNVENLYLLLDTYDEKPIETITEDEWQSYSFSTTQLNKPLQDLDGIKRAIENIDADVYMLCEVGGLESLKNFNRLFLGGKYDVHIANGNSKRGLCVGYLTKSTKYTFSTVSNKNYRTEKGRFCRDVYELHIKEESELKLVTMLTHLKSKRSSEEDYMGMTKRKAEADTLVELYGIRKEQYQVPIIVTGDLNGFATKNDYEPEFEAIYTTDLLDAHDIAGTSHEDRATHVRFGDTRYLMQLDYMLLSEELHSRLRKVVSHKFKDEYGYSLGLPDSFQEKKWLPSDHFPVVVDISDL